ncbi:F-box protein SKIP31-like isoform X3 [Phoenix dactylifera]|uniref:F-box protein SKIP31-like isoform X3 n=1 Tax=Phoenix dactylifera TaxID=42345 RepID=A0A8B7BS04_PHODC|nr:F-box protein SKIP31-like isoform X3 [Phoenix dactylifera]
MAGPDDEDDEVLAHFLECEILSGVPDQQDETAVAAGRPSKRPRIEEEMSQQGGRSRPPPPRPIESGIFSKMPPELFHRIFKFLSSEDLTACSLVCNFMNFAASDESLWRRLYCMRWGLAPPNGKLRACAWKELYIQVNDDRVILDRTVADQVSIWKSSRGLTDEVVTGHVCSGNTCSYSQIGDVFICEKTGGVHVCDDSCREVVLDQSSGLLVCTISGHCFDRWLSPDEESDPLDIEEQLGVITDEAEPFMGSGRFARAYLLGYNCADEKELEKALRFC